MSEPRQRPGAVPAAAGCLCDARAHSRPPGHTRDLSLAAAECRERRQLACVSPLPTATRQWLVAMVDIAVTFTRAAREKDTTTCCTFVSQTLTSLSKPPAAGRAGARPGMGARAPGSRVAGSTTHANRRAGRHASRQAMTAGICEWAGMRLACGHHARKAGTTWSHRTQRALCQRDTTRRTTR